MQGTFSRFPKQCACTKKMQGSCGSTWTTEQARLKCVAAGGWCCPSFRRWSTTSMPSTGTFTRSACSLPVHCAFRPGPFDLCLLPLAFLTVICALSPCPRTIMCASYLSPSTSMCAAWSHAQLLVLFTCALPLFVHLYYILYCHIYKYHNIIILLSLLLLFLLALALSF